MSQESKQERRAMRDRFALAAMQSLIQNFAIMDAQGYGQSIDPNDLQGFAFISIAGEAHEVGWGYKNEIGCSRGMILADEAYMIAQLMMKARDEENQLEDDEEQEQETDYENDEEATEEPESSANTSGRRDDGSPVLELPAVEPATNESQVGSDQQACSECMQETQPER